MALFAGVEMTFVQMINPGPGEMSSAQKSLLMVSYVSILINLVGAAGSLSMVTTANGMRNNGKLRDRLLITGALMGFYFMLGCISILISIEMWIWMTLGGRYAGPLLIVISPVVWFLYTVVF